MFLLRQDWSSFFSAMSSLLGLFTFDLQLLTLHLGLVEVELFVHLELGFLQVLDNCLLAVVLVLLDVGVAEVQGVLVHEAQLEFEVLQVGLLLLLLNDAGLVSARNIPV